VGETAENSGSRLLPCERGHGDFAGRGKIFPSSARALLYYFFFARLCLTCALEFVNYADPS
jgi:hypothetical protein